MSDCAISLSNISKMYKMFFNKRHRICDALGIRVSKKKYQQFWALRDINLEIKRGSKVGLIGYNGAGKSTLLKIIAGQIKPSSGNVIINGTIQALMELGTGFHPEFSGKENIYSALAYQGVSPKVAEEKYKDIVKFSELSDFIKNPVKTYSAGMYARLAFSVATSITPDILIIDEILGAGDAYFAGKCIARMKELTSEGTTVLFVSHDMSSVQQLCDEAIWIKNGQIEMRGKTLPLSKKYLRDVRERDEKRLLTLEKNLTGETSKSLPHSNNTSFLFRLIGQKGSFRNDKLAISSIFLQQGAKILSKVEIGLPGDNDEKTSDHLITDPRLMEWSECQKFQQRYCRFAGKLSSKYKHAPFKIDFSSIEDECDVQLAIEYFDHFKSAVEVQFYFEERYHLLGTIESKQDNKWKIASFSVPQYLLESISGPRSVKTSIVENNTGLQLSEDDRYGSGGAEIVKFYFCKNDQKDSRRTLICGEEVKGVVEIHSPFQAVEPVVVLAIYRLDGICALQAISKKDLFTVNQTGKVKIEIQFSPLLLGPGDYVVSIALFKDFDLLNKVEPPAYDVHDRAYPIKVLPPDGVNVDLGIVNHPVNWSSTRM